MYPYTFFFYFVFLSTISQSTQQWGVSLWDEEPSQLFDDYSSETDPVTETPITIILPVNTPLQFPVTRPRSWIGRSGYGEPCDDSMTNTRCAPNAQLSCIDDTCQCSKPEEMLYNPTTLKCHVRSGEQCKYEISVPMTVDPVKEKRKQRKNPYDPTSFYTPGFSDYDSDEIEIDNEKEEFPKQQQKSRYEVLTCVPNARCLNSRCTCNPSFFEGTDGHCLKKRDFSGNCTTDKECKDSSGFKCVEGICSCNPLLATENQNSNGKIISKNRCVGLVGQPCIRNQCEDSGICQNNVCNCKSNLTYDKNEKTCKSRFGGVCQKTEDCLGSLGCLNGVCNCLYQNHQLFDEAQNKCVSVVEAPCEQDQDCVPHATCRQNSNGPETQIQEKRQKSCQCAEGFIESGPGFCRASQGTACAFTVNSPAVLSYKVQAAHPMAGIFNSNSNSATQGDDRLGPLGYTTVRLVDGCATDRQLNCLNSTCSCEPIMETFDEKVGACVGLAGALCRLEDANYCGENLKCDSFNRRSAAIGFGRCSCVDGFVEGAQRRCVK